MSRCNVTPLTQSLPSPLLSSLFFFPLLSSSPLLLSHLSSPFLSSPLLFSHQVLFYHVDQLTDWLLSLQWDETPLQRTHFMLDFPSVQHGAENRREEEDQRTSPRNSARKSPRSDAGFFFPVGRDIVDQPTSPRSPEGGDDKQQGAGVGMGVRWSVSQHPTPRSLVIGISVNIITAMKMYQAQHTPHADNDHSTNEEENSNISSATLKKLSKLSSLPHRSENLDFLSASFPHLPVQSNSPKGDNSNELIADEEEEDEI